MRRAKSTLKVLPFAALLLAAATALATRAQFWNHQSEQDFAEGTFDNTVINSYGELMLGRELKTILLGEPVEMVVGMVGGPDGAMYAATTPDAKIFRIAEGKAKSIYQLPEAQGILTTLGADAKGVLLAATSGKHARLLRLDMDGKAKPATVFEKDGVASIWSILSAADGAIYVGTGPKAQVYKVAADGTSSLVLEAGAGAGKNIVSLALDKQNRLIAGTDGTGLVIRAAADGKPFVLHDAGAVDITAIVLDDDGNLYASASKGESGEPNFGGMEDEGPGTKSKPGATEPEPVDLPDDEPATKPKAPAKTRPSAPATQGMVPPALLPFGVLADKLPELSPELKALLQKASPRGVGVKDDPASRPKHPPTSTKIAPPSKHRPARRGGLFGGEGEGEAGNAVYKIAPDGSVNTIFSGQETIMSLLWHKSAGGGAVGGELLIGTGTSGRVFAYTPADEAQALVARVKEETVTALALAKDGTVFAGASNMGQVYTLSADLAKQGSYTSKVLDAARSADWGRARITPGAADKGSVTFSTRTGNVQDVEKSARFWSDWSAEAKANDDEGVVVSSPKARYLQYRVTLKSGAGGGGSPAVSGVKLSYQIPNLPPKIKELTVESETGESEPLSGEASELPTPVTITWDATDPNHDTLTYRVYYRPAAVGDSAEGWTLLGKDIKSSLYDWTTTAVADGKYQVKVVASDAADNPVGEAKSVARVSPAFVINHTPAVIGELKAEVGRDGRVSVSGSAKDALSPLVDVRIQVSGQPDWVPGKASDGVFDSLSENFTAATRVLPAGEYRLTVRVTDTAGNSSYKAVAVKVP